MWNFMNACSFSCTTLFLLMNINNDEEVFEDLLAYWSRIVDNLLVEFNMAQRFNAVARSNDELNDLTAEVRKLDRQGLTAREREKLH